MGDANILAIKSHSFRSHIECDIIQTKAGATDVCNFVKILQMFPRATQGLMYMYFEERLLVYSSLFNSKFMGLMFSI